MRPEKGFDLAPAIAIWEVTRACDLCCLHCRASAIASRDPGELSTTEALGLLDQLAELMPGVLVLTGGDPLKRPDLFDIIVAAVKRGLSVAITPSVTPLLTAAAIRQLAASGISRIALSLDGPDPGTHDVFRGRPGAFDATMAAIESVRSVGLPLQINTSVNRGTVAKLRRTGNVVAQIAPVLWSVFFVVPVGRAAAEQQMDAETCEGIFDYLYEWATTTGLAVKTTAAPAYRRVVLQRNADLLRAGQTRRPRPMGVNDGKGFVFISHTGEVYPSGFLPLTAGNIRRTRVAELYRHHPLFVSLRDEDRLEGKCGVCPYRTVCGGSRARAYAATGNIFASDPSCVYRPPQWAHAPEAGEQPAG